MSDFDREAERERLREKYEQDREKRQSTQRMSELLLRGATMTDSHCDDCGDPIFRYDGQEFCATCRAEGAPEPADTAGETEPAGPTETSEPASSPPAENGETPPVAGGSPPTERVTPEPELEPEPSQTPPAPERAARDRGDTASGGGDLRAARDSLARTVARFARRAEETDHPREAADHLAAAREAAEALAALDRR
jgi:uncharacterized Zn finger protein (UPF0148 family)